MAKVGVLLDACVLYPMYLRDTLLSVAEAGLYLPYWSQKILDEAISKLVSKGIKTVEQASSFEAIIKEAFPEAMIEVPPGLEEVMTNHPKDRHVLAAAVVAKADIIVTDNLPDFKAEDIAPWNIKAQSPDEFLTDLFNDDPDSIIEVVRQQSNKYKEPKKSVAELLDFLDKKAKVPKFASNVLFYEYCTEVVQVAKKALSKIGMPAPEGGRVYEGERYRLWQRGQFLTITAKDDRGDILRVQNGEIDGDLSIEDIKAFQLFNQRLLQELS